MFRWSEPMDNWISMPSVDNLVTCLDRELLGNHGKHDDTHAGVDKGVRWRQNGARDAYVFPVFVAPTFSPARKMRSKKKVVRRPRKRITSLTNECLMKFVMNDYAREDKIEACANKWEKGDLRALWRNHAQTNRSARESPTDVFMARSCSESFLQTVWQHSEWEIAKERFRYLYSALWVPFGSITADGQ